MFPDFFEFYNPTKIVYGQGISLDIKAELDIISVKKYFIVSDKIINEIGMVQKISKGLEQAGIEIAGNFIDVPENSEIKVVASCAKKIKESGAEGIIAIGGGSVIDTAKAANILVCKGGDLIEDHSGVHTLTEPLMPLVVIPTTAGTGSEVTNVAVVYDEENNVKIPFADKFLLPTLAVLDPEVTLSLPQTLTAGTAMDALTHAIEAYVGLANSPASDVFAIGAIELIFKHVADAVEDGKNIEARSALLIASNLAGVAFSHSMCGCVHGMAHSVGGLYHVPHGIANTILLPYGMEYNLEEVKEKFAKLSSIMGEDIKGLSVDEAAKKAVSAVRKLNKKLNEICGIPLRLRDAGVPEDGLEMVAEATVMDGTSFYNPCEVVAEDILHYLKKAY
jgi:alcohol dehydrogenase